MSGFNYSSQEIVPIDESCSNLDRNIPQYRNSVGSAESINSATIPSYAFEQQYQAYLVANSSANANVQKIKKQKKVDAGGKRRKLNELLVSEHGDDETEFGPWMAVNENEEEHALKRSATKSSVNNQEQNGVSNLSIAEDENEVDAKGMFIQDPAEEDEMWEKVNERKISAVLPPRPQRGSVAKEATSVFHGGSFVDYQGRSWSSAPAGVRAEEPFGDHECFIPKRCARKLTGHSKGVQALEFSPLTGHLLLSASMDGTCKVWDSHSSDTACAKRTYSGHSEAVRAIHMTNDGSHFLSSGFDRYIRHWDLESGKALATFSNRKMSYSVKYCPRDNNLFITAASDNRVYQWDIRTGEVCQEYNYHLQPCNTVTFIDEGRKFVSTSDDKKMLVWEFGIPVPIKYIAEPDMQCIPSVTVHPSQQFLVGQSMDNSIVVYSCGDKVKQLRKKTFRGHNNSGYACQMGFSPNGRFLVSGDGQGLVHYWDWKTTKSYRKFHAHDNGPCMAAVWHPLSPSMVATCGWDGVIKLWDS